MIIRSRRTFWEGRLCPAPEFAPQGVGACGTDGAGNARRLRRQPLRGEFRCMKQERGEETEPEIQRLFFLRGKRIDRNIL